jgi:hypothetical protein
MLQARRSCVPFPMRSLEFSIDLMFPAALWPWVDSDSNRNEYQECSWSLKGGRRHLWADCLENVGASTSHNHMGLHGLLTGIALPLPSSKTIRLASSVGLLKGWNREGCTIDHWSSHCKGRCRPTPYSFIHSINGKRPSTFKNVIKTSISLKIYKSQIICFICIRCIPCT